MEEKKGNGTELKHGGYRPSLAQITKVKQGLEEISNLHAITPTEVELHAADRDLVRPPGPTHGTRERGAELVREQRDFDALKVQTGNQFRDFRKQLMKAFQASQAFLGEGIIDHLRNHYTEEFQRYVFTQDPALLLGMLVRFWALRAPFQNPDLDNREAWQQIREIPAEVNAADRLQRIQRFLPASENKEFLARFMFMGQLSAEELAAYNATRNQMRASSKDIETISLAELANHVAEKVQDARALVDVFAPRQPQAAMAAVGVVCSFCGKRNHAEDNCRQRLAAIKALQDGRPQGTDTPKGPRRLDSDGAGAPRPERACYKCGKMDT